MDHDFVPFCSGHHFDGYQLKASPVLLQVEEGLAVSKHVILRELEFGIRGGKRPTFDLCKFIPILKNEEEDRHVNPALRLFVAHVSCHH